MDNLEVKKIWNEVKEEIIKNVPATSHPWILPLEPVGYENGIFKILTGKALAIQIIRKNHYQQILDTFKNLGYGVTQFDIIFDEKLSNELKKQKEKEKKAIKKTEEKSLKENDFDGIDMMKCQL